MIIEKDAEFQGHSEVAIYLSLPGAFDLLLSFICIVESSCSFCPCERTDGINAQVLINACFLFAFRMQLVLY